ncbi:MAG: hypothetical protein M0Z31_15845 [Clostridia bacterium]|nr:hypothetical protein [Clostridia bacterium]
MAAKNRFAGIIDYYGLRIIIFLFGVLVFLELKASIITAVILAGLITFGVHVLHNRLTKVRNSGDETPEEKSVNKEEGRTEFLKADKSKVYKFILTAAILGSLSLLQDGWVRYYFLMAAVLNLILCVFTFRRWKRAGAV